MKRLAELLIPVLELIMAIGLLVIATIVVIQVVLSSCFNSSITGANEVITIVFVYITSIGAAVAVGKGEHIAITFAVDKMSRQRRRVVDIANLGLVAILNLTVALYSVHWIGVTGDYLMPTTQLPRFVAQASIPIGSALAILFCVARLTAPMDPSAGGASEGDR